MGYILVLDNQGILSLKGTRRRKPPTGTVLQVGDGIACIHSLNEVIASELVKI